MDAALVEAFLTASRVLVAAAVRSLAAGHAESTLPPHRALVLLAARGPQRVANLAELLAVNSSTATRHCDRLQRRALVQRGRSADDRRAVRVSLTTAGNCLIHQMSQARRAEISRIMRSMSDRSHRALLNALRDFGEDAGEVPEQHWSLGWGTDATSATTPSPPGAPSVSSLNSWLLLLTFLGCAAAITKEHQATRKGVSTGRAAALCGAAAVTFVAGVFIEGSGEELFGRPACPACCSAPLCSPSASSAWPSSPADRKKDLVDMQLSTNQAVLGALAIAVVLAGLHWAAPHIRRLPFVPEAAIGSFAGGLAVAYVFLHLLPEIAEGNEAIGQALSDVLRPTPLMDLGIFVVALAGFTAFFALERLADRCAASRTDTSGAWMPRERPTPVGVYRLHLGSFAVYNALITYTMPLRLRTGVLFALLFVVAMGLHFVLTDRTLEERYRERFGRAGRLTLAFALLLGWGMAAAAAPTSTLLVALLTALLGGSILLNVFKEEIPSGRRTRFGWFLTGLVLYAGLLAAVTALSE